VAKIKVMLASAWGRDRKKDPGRGSKCRQAGGKRVRGVRSPHVDREAARKGNPDEWFPGEREAVITAPVTRARGKERDGSPKSPPRGLGQGVAKGKDDRGDRERDGSSESPPCGQSQEVASGKSSRETTASFSESKGEDGVEDGDEWTESGDQDYEENLTYHEDSLSVFKGHVSTPLGEDVPVFTTTDSGSMTQLMERQFAVRLKLKRRQIPEGRTFHINSPGGGSDEVSEYVILHLKIPCKKETMAEQGYEECESEIHERVVKMKFGLCEQLPVPVLWGGQEMRDYDLLDYHASRTISMKLDGPDGGRVITPSMSWLAATVRMGEELGGPIRKAYRSYLPTRERLTNMVTGGRQTINMPAILYPGRDSVVRVARHNARVDEGYNEVLIDNMDEFAEVYGQWVTPMECVTNGESFVVVRNNSTQAIRLTPGAL
jgi:hypothetical protein